MTKRTEFYTPVFSWSPDPDQDPNYVIFADPAFAADNPIKAVNIGQLADICGFPGAFGFAWNDEWSRIDKTSGPFVFRTIPAPNVPNLSMRIAVIDGPFLKQMLKSKSVSTA